MPGKQKGLSCKEDVLSQQELTMLLLVYEIQFIKERLKTAIYYEDYFWKNLYAVISGSSHTH